MDEKKEMEGNGNKSSPSASSLKVDNDEDLESPQDNDDDNDSKPEDKYASQNYACELSSMIISSVDKLPPLPKPRHDVYILHEQEPRGICTVTTGIVVCVFLTHYIAMTLVLPSYDLDNEEEENPYQQGKLVFLALIYAETIGAIICTAGIVFADPCVVKRTEETCNPVPKKVEHW
eukprot:CAMPEP_0116137004 /NCGR_PEP_ID=MMETSP0329-20121206/12029_1 /TAXON_ID=697910 /ORGANISM="Pseudo-nitzschia arenysensis, Strain B593" /LENGTH=175 /DNA_ID=CAMNT_0003631915 /DNA_START=122 /DNA_END=646 /DNA_ORIENTATION=-